MNLDRREFLKFLSQAASVGAAYMVIPMPSFIKKQLKTEKNYNPANHDYVFIIDINKCIGCGSCCVADKREYNVPDGYYRTWVERYIVTEDGEVFIDSPNGAVDGYNKPRKVNKPIRDSFFVPKLCNMCKEPACVQVCPAGATFKTDDGFVLIDYKRCVGCMYCIQACPYGARFLNPNTHTADKCTWCYHRVRRGLLPACVNACPTKARKFGDLKDKNSDVYKIVKSGAPLFMLKPDMGTYPRLRYKNLRQEVV